MIDSTAPAEMLRSMAPQEQPGVRTGEVHAARQPEGRQAPSPPIDVDQAKIPQLQRMLEEAARGQVGLPEELAYPQNIQQNEGPGNQAKFSLVKWFESVFHYLTNNMFVKKK